MVWKTLREWNQKRKLRDMLNDPRSARGFRSIGQLEKGIGADRSTTERLLLAVGAEKVRNRRVVDAICVLVSMSLSFFLQSRTARGPICSARDSRALGRKDPCVTP